MHFFPPKQDGKSLTLRDHQGEDTQVHQCQGTECTEQQWQSTWKYCWHYKIQVQVHISLFLVVCLDTSFAACLSANVH